MRGLPEIKTLKRYAAAVALVVAAAAVRLLFLQVLGTRATWIMFYPAIVLAAVYGGLGPGLLATAVAALLGDYFWIEPRGSLVMQDFADWLNVAMFGVNGTLISCVAEALHRVQKRKAAAEAAAQVSAAVRDSEARLAGFVSAMFEGLIESEAGQILDCNEQYARMSGYSVAELKGMALVDLIPPEERPRAAENIDLNRESVIDGGLLRKDGSRIVVEAHGRPAAAGRHRYTAIRDITERKRAEEALRASLAEKEVLLKEIHHRVKNNMQVVSSLVSLQAERLQDTALRTVFEDVAHRVRSMALVHEKLYQSGDLAKVEFAEYAECLLNYLWRAHGSAAACVRLRLDLQPLPLPVNAAVPCGLILNELASNALKHAFRKQAGGNTEQGAGNEVRVSLRTDSEGRVRLGIRDNGVGLPPGLDWRRADSLGLRLVEMLAKQLGATVEVADGGGTEFIVTFAKN